MSDARRARVLQCLAAGVLVVLAFLTVKAYLEGETGDFIHFYDAARAVWKGEHIYTYGELDTEVNWYAYLPLFAVMLAPLALLPMSVAGAIWALVNVAMLSVMLIVAARECISRLELPARSGAVAAIMLVAMLPLLDKLRQDLELGQSDILVGLCMVLGLAWADRRPVLAGIVLGIATNVKLQGLIFLPYLIVRGRWRQAASLVGSSVLFALGGSLIWGWERNLDYLRVSLGGVASVFGVEAQDSELWGLTWNRSVSIPSVAGRATEAMALPGATTIALTLLAAGLLFALGWWMFRAHGFALFRGRFAKADIDAPARGLVLLEWSGLIVAALAFSPQTSPRHFIPALLVTSVAAGLLVTRPPSWRNVPLLTALILFGATMVLPPGGQQFDDAVRVWRAIGGPMWGLLVCYMVTLHAGLAWLKNRPACESTR